MKSKKKIEYHDHAEPESGRLPNLSNVASANECTGLMYRAPLNDAELESFQQLSSMAVPEGEQDTRCSLRQTEKADQRSAKDRPRSRAPRP